MIRQWRIEFEGEYYHILSRGNDRRNIFTDDDDRIVFLEILGNMSERFEIEVYAYVLMNNHYHLLLKTNKSNISKSMQWFGTTYTRRYNIKHRSKYLSEKPDVEIPQKRQVLRDTNPGTILEKAARVLRCNVNDFLEFSRICNSNKRNRDVLIYLKSAGNYYEIKDIEK